MAKKKNSKTIKLAEPPATDEQGMQNIADSGTRISKMAFGNSGTRIYGGQFDEDYLPELLGHKGSDTFDKVRRSESQVAMLMGAVYNPIKSATWDMQADDENNADQVLHRDFIKHILFETLPRGWPAFLNEALSCIPFGFSVFEVVHNVVFNHAKFGTYNGLANLGFRKQRSIFRWNLERKTGKLLSVEQQESSDVADNAVIPGEFILTFSINREGDNFEGISALRPMYGAYKRKQLYLKLTAIGVEKYAYGIILGTVPSGKEKSPEFKSFVDHLTAYTANEKSFLIRPAGWDVDIKSNVFDAQKMVELLKFENTEMINAMVANFLALGMHSTGGSYALGQDLSDFFLGGIQAYANLICEELNRVLIPQLIKMNFGEQPIYPKIKCSGINDNAGKELAETLTSLLGSKALTADSKLEEYLRKLYKLPTQDESTARQQTPPAVSGAPTASPVTKLKEVEKTFKLAENSARYRKQWEENKAAVKETMQKGLRKIADSMLANLKTNFNNAVGSNYIKAANNLKYSGVQEYVSVLKNMFASIAVEAINEAKKEIPGGKNIKLAEDVKTFKFGDYETLPPFLKALVDTAAKNMEAQVGDVEKLVTFQFGNSAVSTDNFDIIENDINQKVNAMLDGSTASGASIDAAAGNVTSFITQTGRNELFFSPDVLSGIESFTFTNEDPVSPICQDLAGTTFSANDPEADRYFPPLHHNCKSRLVPNMVGDSNNPEIDPNGLQPSRASLEKYITLSEYKKPVKLAGDLSACVAGWMPELMAKGHSQEQALAIAYSKCGESAPAKK
jgi:SPP1 gp7 family putative phage head morphogenesis protein